MIITAAACSQPASEPGAGRGRRNKPGDATANGETTTETTNAGSSDKRISKDAPGAHAGIGKAQAGVYKPRRVTAQELGLKLRSASGDLSCEGAFNLGGNPMLITVPEQVNIEAEDLTCTTKEPAEALVAALCSTPDDTEVVVVQVQSGSKLTCANGVAGEDNFEGALNINELPLETARAIRAAQEGYGESDGTSSATGSESATETNTGTLTETATATMTADATSTITETSVDTEEEVGCNDVRQIFLTLEDQLETAQTYANAKDPTRWDFFTNPSVLYAIDAKQGCYTVENGNAVNERIKRLEAELLKATNPTKQAQLQALIAKLKKVAPTTDDGSVCVVPGAFIRRLGNSPSGDYALLVDGNGYGATGVRVTTEFMNWKALDPKYLSTCPRFENDTLVSSVIPLEGIYDALTNRSIITFENALVNRELGVNCSPYMGAQVRMTIEFVTEDKDGYVPVGNSCEHFFKEISPLVLDLSGAAMVSTVPPAMSTARFDLTGNGRRTATGWINADSALLALDRNGNGSIDNGTELFGEATKLPDGSRAANGFAALAQYDLKGKGYVDASDPVFAELRLWLDRDGDGVSKADELKTLAEIGVTRIETRFTAVGEAQRYQGGLMGNDVRYRAKFFGPSACGKDGCGIYDVYFGTSETRVSKNAR